MDTFGSGFVIIPRKDYGSPISRARIFIILIREDLALKKASDDFPKFANEICESLQCESDVDWQLGSI